MSLIEERIIYQAQKQDKKAQTILYNKYKRIWYTMCLRYNSNDFDANDCLQTAMVNIYSNLNQYNPAKASFSTWSTRIVINANIQFLKKKESLFSLEYAEANQFLTSSNENFNEHELLNTEQLKNLIQKLPTGYRTIFNLYVLEGFTHVEIADILNITVGTSKSQLSKAKRFLKSKIEEISKTVSA